MPESAPDRAVASQFAAALAAIDRVGDHVVAAFVPMTLVQVERRAAPKMAG